MRAWGTRGAIGALVFVILAGKKKKLRNTKKRKSFVKKLSLPYVLGNGGGRNKQAGGEISRRATATITKFSTSLHIITTARVKDFWKENVKNGRKWEKN
jgi:hypothetical protein